MEKDLMTQEGSGGDPTLAQVTVKKVMAFEMMF
jgi:hypothetical protein